MLLLSRQKKNGAPDGDAGVKGRDEGRCDLAESQSAAHSAWDLVISGARLLDDAGAVDIAVKDGSIEAIAPEIRDPALRRIDAAGGMVTCSFVEPHFHLDKCLSRPLVGAISPEDAVACVSCWTR